MVVYFLPKSVSYDANAWEYDVNFALTNFGIANGLLVALKHQIEGARFFNFAQFGNLIAFKFSKLSH